MPYNCTSKTDYRQSEDVFMTFYILTCVTLGILVLRELAQIYHVGHHYAFDMENWDGIHQYFYNFSIFFLSFF
jgi:hypothetical protein